MEKINKRYQNALLAFEKLQTTLIQIAENNYDIGYDNMRDSLIQRFEFCTDTLWKLLKLYLTDIEKIKLESSSPRGVFRAAADAGVISNDDYEGFIKILEDRNLTSHTYNEDLAQEISERIPEYFVTMSDLLQKIKPDK